MKTSMRGRTFTGVVVSDKMSKTVTVEWTRRYYIPKYERYEKRRSRVKAHNPDEIDAQTGDQVVIKETRPLSKTKHFIVIKKLAAGEAVEQQPEATTKKPVVKAQAEGPKAEEKTEAKKPAVKKAAKKTVAKKATKTATKKTE